MVAEVMTKIYNRKKLFTVRKILRNNLTKSEVILWQHLKGKQFGFKFRRQQSIGKYVTDFYCSEIKLAVEIDGFTHAEEEVFKKDEEKQNFFETIGITVKRYNDQQIFNDLKNVSDDLYQTGCELKQRLRPTTPAPPALRRGGPTPPWKGGDDIALPNAPGRRSS